MYLQPQWRCLRSVIVHVRGLTLTCGSSGQRWPEFKQRWPGSSGQTLLAELSSMIPAVCSHAWRRHQNLARQSCYYNGWTTTNRRLLVGVDGQKIKGESWGTKSSRCCHPKPVKISTEQGGKVAGFSSFGHRRSSCFPATWTIGAWWPVCKLQIGTKLDRLGGRNHKISPGRISGQTGRVSGRFTASLTLSYVCICFPVSNFFFYFYLLFNRLIFFFFFFPRVLQ